MNDFLAEARLLYQDMREVVVALASIALNLLISIMLTLLVAVFACFAFVVTYKAFFNSVLPVFKKLLKVN